MAIQDKPTTPIHEMNPGQTGDEMGGLIVLVEYAK